VIKSAKGSNYKVTFAALVIGAVAFALLQSMMLPVLPTIQRNLLGSGLPAESGYARGFAFLAAITVVVAAAALLIPKSGIAAAPPPHDAHLDHAELAIMAGGTITDV
jgi:hypothetical protein